MGTILRQNFEFLKFSIVLSKLKGKNSITHAKNSRFRQIHLVYLAKRGRIKKPDATTNCKVRFKDSLGKLKNTVISPQEINFDDHPARVRVNIK